jgi:YesN/AraC family two-component response regulator
MENYYSQTITLEELATIIHVSTHYLCKLFKSAFGLSPFNYLARIRMQIAKSLLIQCPEQKIKEIAEKVGYNDTSYFIQVFKDHEKVTPIQFRRLYSKV